MQKTFCNFCYILKVFLVSEGHKHGKAIIEMICEDIQGKT